MAFAQGSRSQLALGAQSAFGTAVTVDTNLPFTSHSLNLSKDRVQGNDIQPDRMDRVDRHGNKTVAGDVTVDLRNTTYDSLIQSALMTSDALSSGASIGTTPSYFTIEDQFKDINKARKFTGMTVSTMGVSIAPNQMVTATFGMVGKDMSLEDTATDVAVDDSEPVPYDSYSGTISVGGSAVSIVTSLDFTLTNSFAPTFVVGSDSAPQLEFGKAVLEGTLTAYVEDLNTLEDLFVSETESSISAQVGDGTNTMTFLIPRVKFNSGDIPVDGPNSRIINLSFVGLYESVTDNTLFKITTA